MMKAVTIVHVHVMKGLMNLISSEASEPQYSGSPCVSKPGGVPDKLCVFPADES